ncbi:MAG TPA: 3-deoxy-7-phosphoheptulonate synthase [Planctomycetota bacterium]|nr:3-deoxy-7-phosphoheptulonate synthase [Planctomycetota bacterium]
MVIVMKKGATAEQIQHVIDRVEEVGLKSHPIYGTERTVIAAIGDKRGMDLSVFTAAPGVERAVPILAPFKVASLEAKQEKTEVPLGPSAIIGGTKVGVVAGPCSVENREDLLRTAELVKTSGAVGLRGGAFKPRTSPYAFQGLEEEGLKYLREAGDRTGLAVVTEVIGESYVELVSCYADVLQIGARNMQNYHLLRAVGQTQKTVLLKRGLSATLEELLLAAEYVLSQGNPNVILCVRGIRSFEKYTRFTMDLAAVPALQEQTHLPVMVDPSHATGRSSLVTSMCRAAVAAGADGLIVEVHPDPEHALSDGAQSMTFETFEKMMAEIRPVAEAVGREL